MLSDGEWRFLEARRVAHLATADAQGAPHVVPVCFAATREAVYIAIDAKPKRLAAARLKRLRNIAENPETALVADRYDDDWSRLGWVMVRGPAELLWRGAEREAALAALRRRYAPLREMALDGLPVIALRIRRAARWGDLSADGPA